MKTKILVDRIKAECASFSSRVAGTAEFEADIERTDLSVPCAFVLRRADTPGESLTANVVVQVMEERFSVIVVVSNTSDPRGFTGSEALDDLKDELMTALLGWAPDTDHDPMEYRGGQHQFMDRARLIHSFDFATTTVIDNL